MDIKSLTIYCSSSDLLDKKYYDLAILVGKFLGNKKITVIYGGGKVGLMGQISSSAHSAGSKVVGIIPKFLATKEIVNFETSKTIIVKNMAERKKEMFELGDAFLIMPGGSGTIEEATEIISWSLLGLHNKPIIIFNFQNYWNSMIKMYNDAKENNFGNKNLQNICENVKTFKEFSKLFK